MTLLSIRFFSFFFNEVLKAKTHNNIHRKVKYPRILRFKFIFTLKLKTKFKSFLNSNVTCQEVENLIFNRNVLPCLYIRRD